MRRYEKACGRCGGSGIYSETHGGCFNCGGNRSVPGSGKVTVIVYTAEEKASNKARSERVAWARKVLMDVAKTFKVDPRFYLEQGFGELHKREPERFEKMLVSMESGRILDVAKCLAAYCEAGYPKWYGSKEQQS